MAPNLTPGVFKIVSLMEGNPPVGVNLTLPGLQTVYINAPVRTWVVRKEGKSTYRLSVGGYPYTGIGGDKVIASIHAEQNVEWRATYQVRQDAYTITSVDNTSRGWTVPFDSAPDSHAVIEIKLIIVQPSEPPNFSTAQLFRFEPIL
jgi:hypothetical protein